jgi:hypothetical protein
MLLMFRRTKLCIVQELVKEQLVNMFGHFKRDNVTRYFASGFFSWIIFSQAPENNIRVIQIFLKIHGDILKSRCTTGINETGDKFATGVTNTNEKFATGINCHLIATSTAGVVETGGNCHRSQQYCWQIMETISGCLQFKVNLKKNYLYFNSATPWCPN